MVSMFLEMVTKNIVFFILIHPSFNKIGLKFLKTGFFYLGCYSIMYQLVQVGASSMGVL